jgi:thymidine kinase
MTEKRDQNPELIIFTGPMFGGKTARLLAALDRYQYQARKIVAFKPKMDVRYSSIDIKTHNGAGIPACSVSSGQEILEYMGSVDSDIDVVAVDEVFMIEGAAKALIHLFRLGYTVIVSSLEMSAACNPFSEVVELMPWATKIEKCPAVCSQCQQDAYFTHRKVDNPQDEIQVGGSDLYEPRCWGCHSYTNAKL